MFDLFKNPFAVLGVTVQDTEESIARAAETAVREGSISEEDAQAAQKALLAKRPRLEAEISWLLGRSLPRIQKILAALKEAPDFDARMALLTSIDGLPRANVAAHLCGMAEADDYVVRAVFDAQNEFEDSKVLELVNGNRAIAGFPKVSEGLLRKAIQDLRAKHGDAVFAVVIGKTRPRKLVERLIDTLKDSTGQTHDLLEMLVEKFDQWSAGQLSPIVDELGVLAAKLRANPTDAGAADAIRVQLAAWKDFRHPPRMREESLSVDEPRGRIIHENLRALCQFLAGEKQEYGQALRISQALAMAFPDLPRVDVVLPEDIGALASLAEQTQRKEAVEELLEVLNSIQANPDSLSDAADSDSGGMAGRLYSALVVAVKALEGTTHGYLPWIMVRSQVVTLEDDHTKAKALVKVFESLIELGKNYDMPAEIQGVYERDLAAFRHVTQGEDLAAALRARDYRTAMELLDALLENPADDRERHDLLATKKVIESSTRKRNRRRRRWAIAGMLVAVLALLIVALVTLRK